MVVSGQQIDFTVINFCMSKNSLSTYRWLAGSNHSSVEERKERIGTKNMYQLQKSSIRPTADIGDLLSPRVKDE